MTIAETPRIVIEAENKEPQLLSLETTNLWKTSLAPQPGDPHDSARTKLRNAFMDMRANAAELVKLIPADCQGLTVHDITHLDALWDIADLILGPTHDLNPAEVFVFGCAVLVHDAGMTVAAYPAGMSEITATEHWLDAVCSAFRRSGISSPGREQISNPPQAIKEEALFSTLRALHAGQAEKLVSITWYTPGRSTPIRLLQDVGLSTAYASSIGRIAHSHNWSIERLQAELREKLGAAADLPSEWVVNEVKVACLLRCSDAAHIDHRRAPAMLYTLGKPKGVADQHWRFQSKLNRPTVVNQSIVFSSNSPFNYEEAAAWWLCYDTIKMIDKELSASSALLQDMETMPFAARRVLGSDSPRILGKHIETNRWRPVDAEIKASHPAQLAETLGGRNLYGYGAFAPVRELLQNSVDAVRARRHLEKRSSDWGEVRLTVEAASSRGRKEHWLHVDDNGVGMPERILVGQLIDFGKSLWNSAALSDEYPGLESQGFRPIGKFGIGFFSVFLLGQHVKVISRSYTSGTESTRVLEFSGLSERPILRDAELHELPVDYNTRVSVALNSERLKPDDPDEYRDYVLLRRGQRRSRTLHSVIKAEVPKLVSALDVCVKCEDRVSGFNHRHEPDWRNSAAELFIKSVSSSDDPKADDAVVAMHKDLLTLVDGSDGVIYGRAALWMHTKSPDKRETIYPSSLVSVGGFAYQSASSGNFYVGILSGETSDITRAHAEPAVPSHALARWGTKQAELVDAGKYSYDELIRAAFQVIRLGGDSGRLPVCFLAGKLVSLIELEASIEQRCQFFISLTSHQDDSFSLTALADINSKYFLTNPDPGLIVFQVNSYTTIINKALARQKRFGQALTVSREHLEQKIDEIAWFLDLLGRVWGEKVEVHLTTKELFGIGHHQSGGWWWVLAFSKVG